MPRLPLAALEAFVLAARMGNLSRAADVLHLTVSALSHQMRGLEQRLGQRLFERNARGVSLTSDGERLLAGIEAPLQEIERSLRRCRSSAEDALTISLMPSVASSWLVPRLPDFVAQYPQLQINLQSDTALVDFDRSPVDLALRFGRGSWPGLQAELLFDEWLTPVVSPGLLASLGRERIADLAQCPLLGDPGNRWPAWFEQAGGRAPARYLAQFSDSETLHRAAVEGLGIALGRMTMAQPLIESGRLLALSEQRLRAEFSHYLVFPPRHAQRAAVQAFRAWVLTQARDYAERIATPAPAPARAPAAAKKKAPPKRGSSK